MSCSAVLTFLPALVLLPLKDLYYILIAIRSGHGLWCQDSRSNNWQAFKILMTLWVSPQIEMHQWSFHKSDIQRLVVCLPGCWAHSCVTDFPLSYSKINHGLFYYKTTKTNVFSLTSSNWGLRKKETSFMDYSFQTTSWWQSHDNQSHCAMESWGLSVFCGGS